MSDLAESDAALPADEDVGAAPGYPLTWMGLVAGAIVGAATAVLTDSLIDGLALGSIFVLLGLTWRKDEAPVFPFIVSIQWLAVVIGRFYESLVGPLPEKYAPGDVDKAIALAILGLITLAIGIRIGTGPATRLLDRDQPVTPYAAGRRARLLFWTVLVLYALEYVLLVNPKQYFGVDQFIQASLACRQILLMVLWYEVLAGRGRMSYLLVSFAWVFLPAVGNYFSTFKGPVVLLFIVAAAFWRPWSRAWWRTGAPRIIALLPVAVLVLLLAVVWQLGVKRETREAYDHAQIGSGVRDRVEFFLDRAEETWPVLWERPQAAFGELVSRLSYITFFSRVLDHVPKSEPYARGELLKMAFENAFVPRALFPNKAVLPSDSYYTHRFAAANVAKGMTSISIGYMAEFYADWGITGMFLSIFGYGVWMGLARRAIRQFVRPAILVDGALATVFIPVADFEHQFIKGFAAINLGLVVVIVVSLALRPWLNRQFSGEPVDDLDQPAEAEGVHA